MSSRSGSALEAVDPTAADRWFAVLGDRLTGSGSVMIVPPGIPPPSVQTTFTSAASARPLTKDEADYVLKTDFSMVVAVRIEYYDRTGNVYWSDMCNFRLATGAIAICSKHNEIH